MSSSETAPATGVSWLIDCSVPDWGGGSVVAMAFASPDVDAMPLSHDGIHSRMGTNTNSTTVREKES